MKDWPVATALVLNAIALLAVAVSMSHAVPSRLPAFPSSLTVRLEGPVEIASRDPLTATVTLSDASALKIVGGIEVSAPNTGLLLDFVPNSDLSLRGGVEIDTPKEGIDVNTKIDFPATGIELNLNVPATGLDLNLSKQQ